MVMVTFKVGFTTFILLPLNAKTLHFLTQLKNKSFLATLLILTVTGSPVALRLSFLC